MFETLNGNFPFRCKWLISTNCDIYLSRWTTSINKFSTRLWHSRSHYFITTSLQIFVVCLRKKTNYLHTKFCVKKNIFEVLNKLGVVVCLLFARLENKNARKLLNGHIELEHQQWVRLSSDKQAQLSSPLSHRFMNAKWRQRACIIDRLKIHSLSLFQCRQNELEIIFSHRTI